ncbi:Set1 complex component swd1 [Rhizoctonia solani AG-1 IA]|uniref:Set1 complex component swd1 n=1 Tax=Thanatephorus cucumeris (strain AG1-IA) TaxID=983506 RepID=L8X1Y4_THACA|nr:Set1 complex component swd1 [Rhizoctonia solani AG-1 IA]
MNAALLDPFGQDYPESVENTLDEYAVCARFNRTGRFIAAGRPDGKTSIWDLETKGVVQVFTGHVKTITSVRYAVWSRNSRYLLTSSKDWNCIIWDMSNGERCSTVRFDAPVLQASFHPRNSVIGHITDTTNDPCGSPKSNPKPDRANGFSSTTARKEHPLACLRPSIRGPNLCSVVQKYPMVTVASNILRAITVEVNSNDRIVRVLEITSQTYDLELLHMFSDPISKTPWNGICFSGDGEYVVAGWYSIFDVRTVVQLEIIGAGHKSGHHVYIWDRSSGALVKILEGPTEPLVDWHPFRPIMSSVASSGLIHIWKTTYSENWSAFAPGFEELEENVEYQEHEDEFDVVRFILKLLSASKMEEDFEVDVETVDPIIVGKQAGEAQSSGQDEDDHWIALEPDDDVVLDYVPVLDILERESEEEDDT